jgi:hypothetical protein
MDYSLLLGIHDCARAELENANKVHHESADSDNNGLESGDDSESGSGLDNKHAGDRYVASMQAFLRSNGLFICRSGWNTPPDSPRGIIRESSLQYDGIIPEIDIYAIPSQEGM